MLNQCWWILVSYITRPLFIVGMVIWALFQFVTIASNQETARRAVAKYPSIYAENYRLSIRSAEDLKRVRAEGKQKEVDFLELSVVIREPPYAEPTVSDGRPTRVSKLDKSPNYIATIAEEFPNVRGLSGLLLFNGGNFQHKGKVVSDLAQFKRLEFLSLIGSIDDPSDLHSLQSIPTLRMLDLRSLQIEDVNKPFPTLANLQTLILGHLLHANDALLASIARLPRLESLSLIGGFGIDPAKSITPKGLADLRELASLKTLYVVATNANGTPLAQQRRSNPPPPVGAAPPADWWQTNLTDTVAMAVGSGVSIRNAYLFPTPTLVSFFMGASVIGMFIGAQLASERCSIMSWLTAGHRSRPLLMAGLWILTFATISALLAAAPDFPLSRTFPMGILIVLTGTVLGLFTLCAFLPNIVRLPPVFLAPAAFYSGLFLPEHYWERIGYFDYLRGLNPQGTLVVITLMLVLLTLLLTVYLPRYEHVPALNPFRAWTSNDTVKVPQLSAPPNARGVQKWLFSSYDHRLENALHSNRLKTHQGEIRRWRVAIPMGSRSYWLMVFCMTAGVISVSFLFPAPIDASIRMGGIMPMTIMAPVMIGFAWRQRRKVFSVELLRPKIRSVFQREMRTAFLLDLIPAFLWILAVLVYVAFSGSSKLSARDVLQTEVILAPAAVLTLTAIAATVVLIRGFWATGILYAILCAAFGIAMSTMQFMVGATHILLAISTTVSLLSLAGLAWLASYWKRMEIGR